MNTEFDLLAETRRLLRGHGETLADVARNAEVGEHWLRKFSQGKPEDPGVLKVQQLYRYLSAHEPSAT